MSEDSLKPRLQKGRHSSRRSERAVCETWAKFSLLNGAIDARQNRFYSTGETSMIFCESFFVGTDDPSINAKRVALRVMEGGHDVPISKIIARYTRSLANCSVVARIADRAYIYDNSVDNASAKLLFRTAEGQLIKHYGDINPWALEILREIDPESLNQ